MADYIMNKAVLMSILPRYCAMIANGTKKIEVRKTRPKIPTPFNVYLYCTQHGRPLVYGDVFRGDWEMEYTQTWNWSREDADRLWGVMNGKIIGEAICTDVRTFEWYNEYREWGDIQDYKITESTLSDCGLTRSELIEYGNRGSKLCNLYGYVLSDVDIYETPKDLSQFRIECLRPCCSENCKHFADKRCFKRGTLSYIGRPIKRPPQSWMYVREEGEINDD